MVPDAKPTHAIAYGTPVVKEKYRCIQTIDISRIYRLKLMLNWCRNKQHRIILEFAITRGFCRLNSRMLYLHIRTVDVWYFDTVGTLKRQFILSYSVFQYI